MVGYQQRTFLAIRQSIQRKVRSTDSAAGTADLITGINRAVNDALHDLVAAANWDFTVREFLFDTTPSIASSVTQAVSIQAGSTHMTGSGSVFTTTDMVGRFILVAGGSVPYEIVAISVAPDTASIVVGFEGSTNITAGSFRILQDSFTIDARVKSIRKMTLERGTVRRTMVFVPPREWDDRIPLSVNESDPRYYTVIRWTADGVPRIRLWPIPSARQIIRFTAYCWLPELVADGDILEVPGPHHRVVEDMAYARLISEVIHEDTPEIQMATARAEAGLALLLRENVTRPDWDAQVGESAFHAKYLMPIPQYPPEFGRLVEP